MKSIEELETKIADLFAYAAGLIKEEPLLSDIHFSIDKVPLAIFDLLELRTNNKSRYMNEVEKKYLYLSEGDCTTDTRVSISVYSVPVKPFPVQYVEV